MPDGETVDLGAWAGDDLADTVRTTFTVGADSDLPDEVRFVAGIAKLVVRCIAQATDGIDSPTPAIFLLAPVPVAAAERFGPKRVPMLDNGLTPVNGRLWFVSPVVVVGSYIELEDYDDDRIFGFVTDELQLGDAPAIVFDPRTRALEVRLYRKGLNYPEEYEASSVGCVDLGLPRILEVVDLIHGRCFITPDAQEQAGLLWHDKAKFIPVENAEKVVQFYLRVGLTTAFPVCTVRTEQHGLPGRLDLEIEESDAVDRSQFIRHAILELKVLRSFWSTGTPVSEEYTRDWVESGVKQAAAYRNERHARAAALCCFDMRCDDTGQDCFRHVIELATTHRVLLKVWFLYASSKQYRDATVG